MKEFFLNKYSSKSESDLRKIVNSRANFQPEAISAAIQLLNEKFDAEIPVQDEKTGLELVSPDQIRRKQKATIDPFRRSFSYRDILTASTLAILFLSYFTLLQFYSSEDIIGNSWLANVLVGFLLILLLNHIFYRIEHRRANSYLGRFFCDLMFVAFWLSFQWLFSFFSGWKSIVPVDNLFGFFVGFAFLLGIFEFLVSFIRYILRLFKWELF